MTPFLHGMTRAVVESFDLPEPIVEIGAYQVEGQRHIADLRGLFPGKEYLGLDMRPGPGQGRMGWVSHDGSSSFAGDELPTLGTYLQALADTLTTGRQPVPGLWEDPRLTPDGELAWWGMPRGAAGWAPAPVGLPHTDRAAGTDS